MHHTPVLHSEVFKLLSPEKGESVLDVTIGLGGHAKSFLERVGDEGNLIGLEADEENLKVALEHLKSFESQIDLHHLNFMDIARLELPKVDIVFADLGLSSPHVDDPERGFTFREDAPLDMRFDRSKGVTAEEMIKGAKEKELADILFKFGELKTARRLAHVIKEANKMSTTFDLKECIEKAIGYRAKHVLPQVFQALRIAVNDELDALAVLLQEGTKLLKLGGRMGIISYHSLEDRMVKQVFRALAQPQKDPITGQIVCDAPFEVLTKKPIVPSEAEVRENPRARSAKLRALKRMNNEK